MAKHRDIITGQLNECVSDPRRWVKYLWAARYHNFFCDERPDVRDELRVDISGIHVRPARLMSTRRHTKLVREGAYAAEVEVELIDVEGGWAPLSLSW